MKTLDWTKPVRVTVMPGSSYVGIDTKVAPRYLGSFVNALQQTRHVVIVTLTDETERCYYADDEGTTMSGFNFENFEPDRKVYAVVYEDRYSKIISIYCSQPTRETAEKMIPDAARYGKVIGVQEIIVPGAMIAAAAA